MMRFFANLYCNIDNHDDLQKMRTFKLSKEMKKNKKESWRKKLKNNIYC